MRKFRFYNNASLLVGTEVVLSDEASHHLSRVLRMKQGQQCQIFDGKGNEAVCEITHVDKKQTRVRVFESLNNNVESSIYTHLGQGLCKGEKMDWIIQKAVELGINEITPLFSEYSDVKLDETRLPKKMQHWQGVLVSACEQCGRAVLPILNTPISINDFIKSQASKPDALKMLFTPEATSSLKSVAEKSESFVLAIGPEGGFSDTEVESALASNFIEVSLGKRVLRTETAAIASLAALQLV